MASILIVDDEETIRDLLKEVISSQGHEFHLAANGTAASRTREIDEAFAAGADGYILKPLDFPTLLGKVAKALASPGKA